MIAALLVCLLIAWALRQGTEKNSAKWRARVETHKPLVLHVARDIRATALMPRDYLDERRIARQSAREAKALAEIDDLEQHFRL